MNHDRVRVARRPVVALVATGDELVMPGAAPGPDQIIASNSFGLEALLRAQGAEVRMLPIAPDRPQALADVLALASGADLIVTIGGASVGDHDLVRDVAGTMGLEMSFYKIAMRPGKPLMAGTLNGTPLIGLPGNPVSSMVCANIFLRPAVDRLLGLPAGPLPRSRARLALAVAANGPREHFMRARRLAGDGMPLVEPFDSQDSALLGVLAAADCLLVRPVGDAARDAGEIVEIIDI
jgi:molybdopterin molybdotransferase